MLILVSKDLSKIRWIKDKLQQEFEMKELGMNHNILGKEIKRFRIEGKLVLQQTSYIEKILNKFNMNGGRRALLPMASHFKF